jgi:DnaK suppressor protein
MKAKTGAVKKKGAALKNGHSSKLKAGSASKRGRAVKPGSSKSSRPGKPGTAHRNGVGVKTGVALLADQSDYRPSDKEPFMNEQQRDYFRAKLLAWRDDILKEAKETLQHLQDENQNHPDLADRASSETDRAIELRARDRQRKLIAKIDAAITRIEDGSYGYCEETGEPISLKRLEARPIATLSIEAQERHERRERVYRDD